MKNHNEKKDNFYNIQLLKKLFNISIPNFLIHYVDGLNNKFVTILYGKK